MDFKNISNDYEGLLYYPVYTSGTREHQKKPYNKAKNSSWNTWTTEDTKQFNHHIGKPGYGVGFRTGIQPDGRYIIGLDFDIFHESTKGSGEYVKCDITAKHFDRIKRYVKSDAVFESSTCGNFGCLVDITEKPELIELLKPNNAKFKINQLEVLLRANYVLPPTKTTCKRHEKKCQSRKFISDVKVVKCNNKLERWFFKHVEKVVYVETTKKRKEYPQKPNGEIFGKEEPPSLDQLETLKTMLKALPEKYPTEYDLWRNIGFAMRSFSDCEVLFTLYCEFSQRCPSKYSFTECQKVWRSDSSKCKKPITWKTINHYYMQDNKKPMWIFKDESIDLLEGVEDLDMKIIRINSEYMTSEKKQIQIFDYNFEKLKNQIYIIKSHTGSGKTTAMSHIRKIAKNENLLVHSIGSRKSLVNFHSKTLNLEYYENLKDDKNFFGDLAIQLDSIMRDVINTKDKYILFLDELNSLISHLKNPLSTMKKERLNLMTKLFKLINDAEFVFGVDADCSTSMLKFLKANTTKPITFFLNEFKPKDKCDVILNTDVTTIKNKIINAINQNTPIFVGSDSLTKLQEEILIPIIEHFKDDKKISKRIKFFSSLHGDRDEMTNADVLKDCFVFVTPCVTYGVDFNYEAEVFGVYYGNSINALSCCQQIARIRKPISINLYFGKDSVVPQFPSYEKFEEFYSDTTNNHIILKQLDINIQIDFEGILLKSYRQYVFESEYLEKRFMNLKFHVCDILTGKGHKIINNIASKKLKTEKGDKCTYTLELLKKALNDEIKADRMVDELQKMLSFIIPDLPLQKLIEEKKNNLLYEQIFNMLLDSSTRTAFFNYKYYKYNSIDQIKANLEKRDADISYHVEKSSHFKLFLVKTLAEKLNVDIFNFDMTPEYGEDKTCGEIPDYSQFVKPFQLRGKIYEGKLNKVEHYKFLMNMAYSCFGDIMRPMRKKINGKEYKYKVFCGVSTFDKILAESKNVFMFED